MKSHNLVLLEWVTGFVEYYLPFQSLVFRIVWSKPWSGIYHTGL